MNPKIIAQKTPQTRIKTTPRIISNGSEIFVFDFTLVGVVPGIPGTGFAVPLKAKEFPSDIGRAGVLVRASSAGFGCMAGISGIPPIGGICGAGVGLTVVGAPTGCGVIGVAARF